MIEFSERFCVQFPVFFFLKNLKLIIQIWTPLTCEFFLKKLLKNMPSTYRHFLVKNLKRKFGQKFSHQSVAGVEGRFRDHIADKLGAHTLQIDLKNFQKNFRKILGNFYAFLRLFSVVPAELVDGEVVEGAGHEGVLAFGGGHHDVELPREGGGGLVFEKIP